MILANAVPDGRVFGLDMQTVFSTGIMLLNAIVLAVVLGYLLYKPVREFMQKRTDRITGEMNEAREKMDQANLLKAQYEKKLEDIDTERIHILEAARNDANKEKLQILDEAREEIAALRQRTQKSIEDERERLKEETRQHIIEVSTMMASKYISQAIDSEQQDKIFEETISELEETTWLS